MTKTIPLSITDFALPAPRIGSIDVNSGFGRGPAIGIEIHQVVQQERKKKYADYESEVVTSAQLPFQGMTFEVSGRMDGVYHHKKIKIEEIKSGFNIFELRNALLDAQNDHPYCLQLKTYGYFHWLKTKEIPDLSFHLVSTRNGDTMDIDLYLNIERYEKWLNLRLSELVEEVKLAEKTIKRRIKSAKAFTFPFTSPRPGQVELMKTVVEGMKENRPLFIQAPTGLGKTIGVLYPALQEALERGQKVIYATPKNSQHAVAEEAIQRLQNVGANIKSLTLTAKSKMCFKNEPLCNPQYCEFAKDHYTKIAKYQLSQQLYKKRSLTAHVFKDMGEAYEVCPFELQFEAMKTVDAIICDYNYVFAPRVALGHVTTNNIGETGKQNLIIDEAHNLPSRSIDYYSPSLSSFVFEKMLKELETLLPPYRKKVERLLNECLAIVSNCSPKGVTGACKIKPPVHAFVAQDDKLREFLSSYLNADVVIEPGDLIMRLSYYWSEFTAALQFVNSGRREFFTTFNPHPPTVKITCCDASQMLKPCYDDYAHVIAFSATLKPFDFYSQLTGMSSSQLKTAEFISPFPQANRKLLIIPQVSSKYSERQRNYPRIAEIIHKISALRRGNYFVFFPSFEFLEKTLELFKPAPGFEVLRQVRGMHKEAITQVLNGLKEEEKAHIIFAVQGGVFSEGVDYPGNMAIGAFIVGPALPVFDLEREKMKEYYDEHYAAGFNYAYIYPAMAKAIQAAGRVIRSETDKGIIVLMDNRFIQASYSQCMPEDWFKESPTEVVSNSILQDINRFWLSDLDQ